MVNSSFATKCSLREHQPMVLPDKYMTYNAFDTVTLKTSYCTVLCTELAARNMLFNLFYSQISVHRIVSVLVCTNYCFLSEMWGIIFQYVYILILYFSPQWNPYLLTTLNRELLILFIMDMNEISILPIPVIWAALIFHEQWKTSCSRSLEDQLHICKESEIVLLSLQLYLCWRAMVFCCSKSTSI